MGGKTRNKCTPVGSESTLPRRWPQWKVCPENAGLLCLGAHQSWLHKTRKKKVLTLQMPWGPAGPPYPWWSPQWGGAPVRHHLYVNIVHLNGNHELGGPIRGRAPSGGQDKRASWRRPGGGLPLNITLPSMLMQSGPWEFPHGRPSSRAYHRGCY